MQAGLLAVTASGLIAAAPLAASAGTVSHAPAVYAASSVSSGRPCVANHVCAV
jgi:hypothetical protein